MIDDDGTEQSRLGLFSVRNCQFHNVLLTYYKLLHTTPGNFRVSIKRLVCASRRTSHHITLNIVPRHNRQSGHQLKHSYLQWKPPSLHSHINRSKGVTTQMLHKQLATEEATDVTVPLTRSGLFREVLLTDTLQ